MKQLNASDWQERSKSIEFRNQAFIDGKFVPSRSGQTFDHYFPGDGRLLTKVAACEAADVDVAVKCARQTFEARTWSGLAPKERKKKLLNFASKIEKYSEELALLITLEMGKPIRDALGEVGAVTECFAYFAEVIDKVYDEIAPTDPSVLALIRREALGVIAAVVPWNFPLAMAAWKLAPALATGNSVVLKPAEQSPLSALRLAEISLEAEIPAGVLNVTPGFGETAGQALGRHLDVDMITFTGSTEVGKLFLKYSAESNMKRVSLECGGKSPHIIFPDTPNLDLAAKVAAFGVFYNQGQVCLAGSRLLVQEDIKDDFLAKVMTAAKRFEPGDPLDPNTRMGSLVNKDQHERVLNYIETGKNEGASLCSGGSAVRADSGGYYIPPTVFDGVKQSMRIAQEEIFGPVLAVMKFKDEKEAFQIANDTIYGLAAGIWTSDINRIHRAAQQVRAGTLYVNCYNADDITAPFGGFKQSGFGRDQSVHAMEKYTDLKTVWIQTQTS